MKTEDGKIYLPNVGDYIIIKSYIPLRSMTSFKLPLMVRLKLNIHMAIFKARLCLGVAILKTAIFCYNKLVVKCDEN